MNGKHDFNYESRHGMVVKLNAFTTKTSNNFKHIL